MTKRTYYCGLSGAEIVRVPLAAIDECSRQGSCDSAVARWVGGVGVVWVADDATLRRMLRECGAWDDLADATQETLRERALWVACCDMKEGASR